ncbi:MAG: hypothetical protein U9R65_16135, partial [Pseudomonadota bacterium]|nr:hypothetical protein [Pseudomonadota bacterium]
GIGKSAVLKAALEKVDGKIELIIRIYDHQAIRAVCGNGQADADAGFDQCTGIGFASTIP